MTILLDELRIQSKITEKELVEHIEEDGFFEQYPSPVLVERDDQKKCVMISWKQMHTVIRQLEVLHNIARPDYDPSKMITIKIEIDEDLYNKLDMICISNHMTVAGLTERLIKWTVDHPEEVEEMVRKAREDGSLEEYMKQPKVRIVSEIPGDEEGEVLLKQIRNNEVRP